jgi:hypothetical protein
MHTHESNPKKGMRVRRHERARGTGSIPIECIAPPRVGDDVGAGSVNVDDLLGAVSVMFIATVA